MKPKGTLLLTGRDVAALLTIEECMTAVEQAFKLSGEGRTQPPGILGIHAQDGGFHIKAGLLELDRSYFAAKVNANFPENAGRYGLPMIQGIVVLCDGENGYPLALIDSIEITIQRTGAATGVAAKHLARRDRRRRRDRADGERDLRPGLAIVLRRIPRHRHCRRHDPGPAVHQAVRTRHHRRGDLQRRA